MIGDCRTKVEQIMKKISENVGWTYFKGMMGGDPIPPPDCHCNLGEIRKEIEELCTGGVEEYLCLGIDELYRLIRGRVEDVVSRCWEKYASGVCHHLPFISHFGLDRLVDELRKLNVSSATIRTLDNKLAIVDIVNEDATRVTVCIGVRP